MRTFWCYSNKRRRTLKFFKIKSLLKSSETLNDACFFIFDTNFPAIVELSSLPTC